MNNNERRRNPVSGFFRMLVEARWFFTFSASVCATIVGISLTFGINSCRESNRVRKEMEKSIIQASDNLAERIEDTRNWVNVIERENRLYEMADSLLSINGEIPDSVSVAFYNALPYIRLSAFDHEFEKIFRGSYQLWQLRNGNDSLSYYIGQCYDGLNMVESTCQDLSDGMLEQIGAINSKNNFFRSPHKEWTMTLISNPQFQYFMSVRRVKAEIASYILSQVQIDYDENVIPEIDRLRNK